MATMADQAQHEIDFRTIRFIVGFTAISLPALTSLYARTPLDSISESYYEGGWSQTIFIGFIFAIAAFFFAYNGRSRTQMILSRVAAIAALIIAMFPCSCGHHIDYKINIHLIAAVIFFVIITYFCYVFLRRAWGKGHRQAKTRAVIYVICGSLMLATILIALFDFLAGGPLESHFPRLPFYGEAVLLVSFGVSWLTASHIFPVLNTVEERHSLIKRSS